MVVWSDAIIPGVSEWERPLKRETINESCNILPPKESALSLECQLEISGIYERADLKLVATVATGGRVKLFPVV